MRRSGLSAAQQAFALRGRFPNGQCKLKAGRLVWTCILQPTPLSRIYQTQITHGPPGEPEVRVLNDLDTRNGEALPHTYRNGMICLHKAGEWTPTMLLVDTIIPWTSEWLVYYEIWLVTGEWYGGGEWPPPRTGT